MKKRLQYEFLTKMFSFFFIKYLFLFPVNLLLKKVTS